MQRDYRAANRETLLAKRREKYAEDPEKQREYAKARREANPEASKAAWQRWYSANPEYQRERQRRYREDNREAVQARDRERYSKDPHVRARRLIQQRVAKGSMPPASSCPCTDCGGPAEDYDHYLGYEGAFAGMVQPVCRPCHMKREQARREGVSADGVLGPG